MAKQALLGVLHSTIGRYVANLDAESLNVGIWSGQVELHDLELDVTACNAELSKAVPPVPLRVVAGTFASLQIEIPWRYLSAKSVVMKARGLHIQVAPSGAGSGASGSGSGSATSDNAQATPQFAQYRTLQEEETALRQALIDQSDLTRTQTNELMKLTQMTAAGGGGEQVADSADQTNAGFVARLVKRMVENLQVDIQDVSVTILGGDDSNNSSSQGSTGVQLDNLSFVTTDMAGHRTFVDRSSGMEVPNDILNKFLYKKLSVTGLGLFVDNNHNDSQKHAYILEPLDLEAKFREADASITQDYPKWLLKSNLPSVKMALTQAQYQQTMRLTQAVSTATSAPGVRPLLFPQYRPLHRPSSTANGKSNAKEWWQYAYKSIGRLTGRRSWVIFYRAVQKRKTYIPLYKRKVYANKAEHDCPWLQPLSQEETATLEQLDADRTISVEGIMMWRNLADAQIKKEREKHAETTKAAPKKQGGMLSYLFGSGASKTPSPEERLQGGETPIVLSIEELKDLEDVGLDQLGYAAELSANSKLCLVEFVLGELSVNLENAANAPMLGLQMGTVSTKFESDAGGSFDFSYSLSNLEILDHADQRESSLFPCVLRSLHGPKAAIKSPTPQHEDVFQVHMSKSKTGDSKLTVKLMPFETVLAPHRLSEVMDFVRLDSTSDTSTSSSPHIEELSDEEDDDGIINDNDKNNGAAEENNSPAYAESVSNALVEAWYSKTKERTSLTIDLDLQAPLLVLPENCSDPNATVLVLDLGGFRFQYGPLVEANSKVTTWLENNPRDADSFDLISRSEASQGSAISKSGVVVDHGRLELENMTFLVGEADTWRRITSMREYHMAEQEAIIEPITVVFHFAVESAVSSSTPRACVFAAIPTSNFKFSPKHLSKTLRVYNTWMRCLETINVTSSDSNPKKALSDDIGASERGLAPAVDGDTNSGRAFKLQIDEVNKAIETTLSQDNSLRTTLYLDIAVEKYSFVIYDSGDFQKACGLNMKNSQSGSAMPLANIAEGLVIEGSTHVMIDLASDKSGNTSSIEMEVKGQDFEMFSAFGKDLRRPLQILEPVNGTVNLNLLSQVENTKKTEVKARILDTIDVTFSMRNLALINTISTEVSECLTGGLKKSDDTVSESLIGLDQEETKQLEAFELALQSENEMDFAQVRHQGQSGDVGNPEKGTERASSSVIVVNLKVPESRLTIINDLQGLDEALFRVEMQEFVATSMVATMQDLDNSVLAQTIFNVKLHSKVLANYYDPSVNRWKNLLKKPWELAFKAERAADPTSKGRRFGTRADIHLMPIHLTFSENFLIGLGSANRMLAMSAKEASDKAQTAGEPDKKTEIEETRHLVAALPYALDNFSGMDVEYLLSESRVGNRTCLNGSKQYFRFNPPRGKGQGGKRQYGQEAQNVSIKLFIGENTIDIKGLDDQLGRVKRCHILDDSTVVVTTVVREGKSTVVRLASNFSMYNRTPIPMHISVLDTSKEYAVGVCPGNSTLVKSSKPNLVPYDVKDGTLSKSSRRMGLRYEAKKMAELGKRWAETKKAKVSVVCAPQLQGRPDMSGELKLEIDHESMANAKNKTIRLRKEITCTSGGEDAEEFVFQARVKLQLIGDIKLVVNVTLEPRAQFVNTLPVNITVLTRSKQVLSSSTLGNTDGKDTVHHLAHGSKMEVYASGDTLAVKVRCSEKPSSGTPTGMMRQWIEIPLSSELETPLLCLFPFDIEEELSSSKVPGSEFFIAEANSRLSTFFLDRIDDDDDDEKQDLVETTQSHISGPRTCLFTVANYAVDHTKGVLFEQRVSKSKVLFSSKSSKSSKNNYFPFSTFAEHESRGRISLLPTSEIPIRLVQSGSPRAQKTAWFRVEEVSMSEGGAQATPLLWEDGSESGFYTYRKLVTSFQSELHLIAEFLVFNGDQKRTVVVKQAGGEDVKIAPNKTAPVFTANRKKGLPLSFHYDEVDGATKAINLDELGVHIEIVRTPRGVSLGSLAIQTSIGSADSRLVIKLGTVGAIEREKPKNPMDMLPRSFASDNLRFRVQAERFTLTLNQAIALNADVDGQGTLEVVNKKEEETPDLAKDRQSASSVRKSTEHQTENPICTIVMKNVVYDVQKLFKETEELLGGNDPVRCQLSLIVHDFQIFDEMPDSPFPLVFNYSADNRLIDFCVRTKGPLYANTVKIDLFDLIFGHSGKQGEKNTDKIHFQTNEDFVWKLIDTADLISKASAESAEPSDYRDTNLAAYVGELNEQPAIQHLPPQVSTIYDIAQVRVSPFNLVVSFTRTPQAERYEKFINNQGAHLMRYFTQQLKFTIKNCKLQFARYEEKTLKGPMDRLIEILNAVYISRVKRKAVAILVASSFSVWKSLAKRDDGDDEFVHGDILRVAGTFVGNSAAYAFNKAGRGIGEGVTAGFETIGGGVEKGASLIGAHRIGSHANAVIAGVGGGIGGTLQGVGEGTGHVFKGAGQGIGHFFGGITGSGATIVQGIGKGITTGDVGAVASGFKKGVGHMGKGVRKSAIALGSGVGDGVGSVVKGSKTGVKGTVARASTTRRSSAKSGGSQATADLAKLRQEFKDQDYS